MWDKGFQTYLLLSAAFGAAFGIRFSVDLWVMNIVAAGFVAATSTVIVSFLGMGAGEFLGGRVSDGKSRTVAVIVSSFVLLGWAGVAGCGLFLISQSLLLVSAGLFGVGLGMFHTSLDSWFDQSRARSGGATTSELEYGYLAYNVGYLVGASSAFPLMYQFEWDLVLESTQGRIGISVLPYVVAAAVCIGQLLLLRDKVEKGDSSKHVNGYGGVRRAAEDYKGVIRYGGVSLIAVVAIGSGVSVLIQYIDIFSAAYLLGGSSVWEKTKSIAIYNLVVCIAVFVAAALFSRRGKSRLLSATFPLNGATISLLLILACLVVLVLYPDRSEGGLGISYALVLGVAQAMLLALPPVFKRWTLDLSPKGLQATALSCLGIGKRATAIVATAASFVGAQYMGASVNVRMLITWTLIAIASACVCLLLYLSRVIVGRSQDQRSTVGRRGKR